MLNCPHGILEWRVRDMDIGDKVRLIKDNPFGKVGVIIFKNPLVEPIILNSNLRGLHKKPTWQFRIRAEDGSKFDASENQLEIVL